MMGNELIGNTLGVVMNLSLTVVGIGVVFVLLAGYFWTRTKGRSVSFSLGVVLATVMYQALVHTPIFQAMFSEGIRGFLLNLGIFIALVYVSTRVTHSYVHGKFISDTSKKILHVGLLAVTTEGVLFSIAYQYLGVESFYNLSSFADFIYGTEYSLLLWILGLFVTLFFIKSKR